MIDTHCHIHSKDYGLESEAVYRRALGAGVSKIICVGTDQADSTEAVKFAKLHSGVYAAIGTHPHEVKNGLFDISQLAKQKKVVAVGEIGLDYFYSFESRKQQISALESQIEPALSLNLPIIFHVRCAPSGQTVKTSAFDDFWKVLDNFSSSEQKIRGVLHSFSDSAENAEKAIDRGLLIGVNGISTFTKDKNQIEVYKNLPLQSVVFETDAPYLTPTPKRGTINEPIYVRHVAEHFANQKSLSLEEVMQSSTRSATRLFDI